MGGMQILNTNVWGFEHAIRGMRNPMNSWDKSDSFWCIPDGAKLPCESCPKFDRDEHTCILSYDETPLFIVGNNDLALMKNLIKAGAEHSKFMRMIHVSADVVMPRYWWSEADTYHFNTKNSTSTMHKLLNNPNPITKDLFLACEEDDDVLTFIIERLESLRQSYRASNDYDEQTRLLVRAKRLLPEGFLQLRTLDTNYAELRNMYHQRKSHRLKEEWVDIFCKWVESLPYSELITTDFKSKEEE